MATEVARLVATLEAKISNYEKNLRKAYGTTNKQFSRIERRGRTLERRMKAVGSAASAAFVKAFAVAASLKAAQSLVDASTRIENALKVAGLAGEELVAVQQKLFESAQRNFAPYETLISLYSKAAQVQSELGVSSEELISFTDNVALALRVSGNSAEQARGSLIQLGQALGEGTVRAQEFNSILENSLPIAQAAAAGMEEAGGSVARLRKLVIEGRVSSTAFFRAFEAGAVILEEKVANAEVTVSQQFTRLQNVLIDAAGKIDDTTGASIEASKAIERLAGFVSALGDAFVAAQTPIAETKAKIDQLIQSLNTLTGFDVGGILSDLMPGAPGFKFIEEGINRLNSALDDGAAKTTGKTGRINRADDSNISNRINAGRAINRITIDDYPAVGKGGGGGKRSGRAGMGGDSFERELQQLRERTQLLQAMTAAQAQLNPMTAEYGTQLERVRTEQELLAAAERAGVEITPELRAKIADLADSYAQAAEEAEKLRDSQDQVREAADEAGSLAQSAIQGLISDLRNGKDAADAFRDALARIANQLLNLLLNNLFSGGLSGIIKNAKGNAFSGGRVVPYARGGVVTKPTFFPMARGAGLMGEAGPEAVMPLRRGKDGKLGVAAQKDGGSNVQIIVNKAPPGTTVREQKSRDAYGNEMRKVVVDVMNEELASGGVDTGMSAFGARRVPTRRG